jgi:ribonuclease BN (tRNA processing enzyme)
MKLQLLGTGDAFGSGGRFNTCFLVTAPATRFLIDFGATSMVALQRHGIDPNSIDVIFISHLHGDHFGGLPFLLLHAHFIARRTAPLTLVGPPGFEARLGQAMEVFFPGSSRNDYGFERAIHELQPGTRAVLGAVAVTAHEVKHPSGAPSLALRFEIANRVLAFSGDTEWTEALIPVARDSDVFVCETYTYERPVPNHLAFETLRRHLAEIRPKRLILTHMSRDMLDRDLAGALPEFCTLSEDGMVVEF